ncbi:UDP-N-acetylenolpyruvoylglucosamine reductase [hydrothermal vent metagenome]|uniref:UDP-N-acetylmuramate dehydrogenase n=1 Tax=hydrothermal vent metagenome TaxID=652676 RepID=A0A3B1B270_9ZZZZ
MLEVQQKMTTKYNGILKLDEPMSRHTSWRVGGVADQFYQPNSLDDLIDFLQSLTSDKKIYWVGLGSNLLVRDAGIRGTVICTSGVLNEINFLGNDRVQIAAGVACPKMAKKCADESLVGVEFLSGIPGTVGGALFMNAGALGSEIWEYVEQVKMLTRNGSVINRSADEFEVSYRHVSGKGFNLGVDEWFVSGTFKLEKGDKSAAKERIKKILQHRGATQPTQLANAGSVFRNPEGGFAAKLIEDSGLKGFCIGGACVSEKHANFFINTGSATAKDVESLIHYIKDLIKKEYNLTLIVEVKIIGDES